MTTTFDKDHETNISTKGELKTMKYSKCCIFLVEKKISGDT